MFIRFRNPPVTVLLNLAVLFLFFSNLNAQPLKYTANVYSRATKGYYFLNTYKISKYDLKSKGYQLIMDALGNIVYYKNTGISFNFRLQENGHITYFFQDKYYILDKNFKIVDSIQCANGIDTDLHDFLILPNGNFLLLGIENLKLDLSKYKMFQQKNNPGSINAIVRSGVVQELDKNKNLIFEWHAKDHYQFDDVDKFFLNDTTGFDWTHFNSIEQDKDGNLILNARNFNEITKINHLDGSIIWRLGGKRNQFRFINDTIHFCGEHDVRRISNGNITLFDNGYSDKVHFTRAVEYKLDEKNKTVKLIWNHIRKPFIFSIGRGNLQRIKNGNSLVNYGEIKNDNITFEVIDKSGNNTFDLKFHDTLGTYRAFYYPSLPFKLSRPVITFIKSDSSFILDAGNKHKSYIWSTGDTTQTIKVDKPGKYFVYVPYGDGGYISSQIFVVPPQENLIRKRKKK